MGEDKHRRKSRVTGSIQKCLILLCATVFCACFQSACDKEEIQVEEKNWYVYDGTRLNRVYADQFSENIVLLKVPIQIL